MINIVTGILEELSGVSNLKENDTLLGDVGLDSLGMITLILAIEDALHVELEESDMNPYDLKTVSDVVKLAEKYKGEAIYEN